MIPTFSVTPCSVTWRSVLHFAASLSQLDWILKPRMPTGFVSGFVWNVGQNHWKHPRIQWLIITFGFADKQLAIRQSTMVYIKLQHFQTHPGVFQRPWSVPCCLAWVYCQLWSAGKQEVHPLQFRKSQWKVADVWNWTYSVLSVNYSFYLPNINGLV